jgi:hypothetical protein
VSKRRRTGVQGAEAKPRRQRDVYVPRPFAGLPDETEWVALRELVPAATAPLALAPDYAQAHPGREVVLTTVLPMMAPVLSRQDGRVFLALQRQGGSGDASRDAAAALLAALQAEPGAEVAVPPLAGPGPRMQDVVAVDGVDVTVHDSFGYWLDEEAAADATVRASLERADASIYPTVRMAAAPAAYWCRVPGRAHMRWVLPDQEDAALDALARLAAADELRLGAETRFAGMFRSCGLLVPVWDLPSEPEGAAWEQALAEVAKRYTQALVAEPLTAPQRRAREGLVSRQLTLR